MARGHKDRGDAIEGELRQADLSHLRLQEMTPHQRAELKRRYETFVSHFLGSNGTAEPSRPARQASRLKKWAPGTKG
jgi:hypothetical protein